MRAALYILVAAASGAACAAEPGYDSAFAGYQAYREPVVRLAGRDKVAPPKAADPHAGHAMHHGEDPHAGHHPAPAKAEDPPAPSPGHEGHEHHQHHQQKQ